MTDEISKIEMEQQTQLEEDMINPPKDSFWDEMFNEIWDKTKEEDSD